MNIEMNMFESHLSKPCFPKFEDQQQLRRQFKVLIIDDDPVYREVIAVYLQQAGFVVLQAASVDEAESMIHQQKIRLLLCDWLMPDKNGLQLLSSLRLNEHFYHYLILMTSNAKIDQILAGFESGADDYVVKGCTSKEVVARLDCGVRVLFAQEMLEQQQQELITRVQRDALTGLYNRAYLMEVLPRAVASVNRYHSEFSLIICDIDHFKAVNDHYGHLAGDLVLKAVAKVLQNNIRDVDIVARFGGEEFVVALPHANVTQAFQVAEKLRLAVADVQCAWEGKVIKVTSSFGVAAYTADETTDTLLHRADKLLYQSKLNGRNRCSF